MARPALYDHQRQGVNWLLARESPDSQVCGGLMCDDMGLGKTLQFVHLILANPRPTTLIVAPLSVLPQWRAVLLEHIPPTTRLFQCISRKHAARVTTVGGEVTTSAAAIEFASLLPVPAPTTASSIILLATYGQLQDNSLSPLPGGPPWDRVILDEAHTIKNKKTLTFRCAMALPQAPGGSRWAVTGTPVQNKLADVYALFAFIGISPKMLRRPTLQTAHWLFQHLALRRTMETLAPGAREELQFPPDAIMRDHVVVYETEEEEEFYRRITGHIIAQLKALESYPNQQEAARCRLELISQLRFLAVHPNIYISAVNAQRKRAGQVPWGPWRGSVTKNADVVHLIRAILAPTKRNFILFTHFNEELRLFEEAIAQAGYKTFKICGSMSASAREAEIAQSRASVTSGALTAMLIHIRAGGTGLNLQHFNTVIFPSPDWNPAIESQAERRTHRIGQREQVTIYRFFIREVQGATEQIEEYMRRRQGEKRILAGAVTDSFSNTANTPPNTKQVIGMVHISHRPHIDIQVVRSPHN